eukprot:scpid77095/ scgid30007/ 
MDKKYTKMTRSLAALCQMTGMRGVYIVLLAAVLASLTHGQGLPSKPKNLTYAVYNSSTVALSFKPPAKDERVLGYRMSYIINHACQTTPELATSDSFPAKVFRHRHGLAMLECSPCGCPVCPDSANRSWSILMRGIRPSGLYTAQLQARNQAGLGPGAYVQFSTGVDQQGRDPKINLSLQNVCAIVAGSLGFLVCCAIIYCWVMHGFGTILSKPELSQSCVVNTSTDEDEELLSSYPATQGCERERIPMLTLNITENMAFRQESPQDVYITDLGLVMYPEEEYLTGEQSATSGVNEPPLGFRRTHSI